MDKWIDINKYVYRYIYLYIYIYHTWKNFKNDKKNYLLTSVFQLRFRQFWSEVSEKLAAQFLDENNFRQK